MKPILFAKNETNFTTNGLGRLDCISCRVIEERNGMYELEAEIPVDGDHTSEIEQQSIIGVIPHDGGTIQAFYVYKITKPISGRFSVYARHITYRLTDIPCETFSVVSSPSACANTLAGLKSHAVEPCPFTFWTDVTTGSPYNQTVPASIRQRLGGVEGSVIDQFGGEYEWDNWTVKLHNKRGRLANITGITLRYGKNITDINQEEEIANTVTGIMPYWIDTEGDNLVTLPEKVVYCDHAADFPYHLTQVIDFSDKYENKPTVAQLRSAANAYVSRSGFGVPKVSIKVSFVDLWKSEEYKEIAPLEQVKLCDEVTVLFEPLGISQVAEVVKTDYDVLKERYNSIEVGNLRTTLAQAVTDRDRDIDSEFLSQITRIATAISDATAWLTNAKGYVIAVKNEDGSWKELIFANTNSTVTATAGIRINNAGIGFWNKTLHGGNILDGPYGMAWTMDGRLGDFANKNYWNFLTGQFSLSATATLDGTNKTIQGYINDTASAAETAAETAAAQALSNAIGIVNSSIEDLQDQIDGNITTWFMTGVPTLSNEPAKDWNLIDRKNHVGDLYYDSDTGYAYRFQVKTTAANPQNPTLNDFEWVKISDSDISEALAMANVAKNTADKKIVTYAQNTSPTPPTGEEFDDGDLWIDTDDNNKLYRWSKSANRWLVVTDISSLPAWGRNYALGTYNGIKVVNGTVTEGSATISVSDDMPANMVNAENIKVSFYMKLTGVRVTSATILRVNIRLTGIVESTGQSGSATIRETFTGTVDQDDPDFKKYTATFTSYKTYFRSITDVEYVQLDNFVASGTIQVKDFKLEVSENFTPWNYAPEDEAELQTIIDNKITDEIDNYDGSLNQYNVWKKLTNDGQAQGITLTPDGKLYINGTYIATGEIADRYHSNFWNLETGEFSMTIGAKVKDANADYTGTYIPTDNNIPASTWTTDELKETAVGTTFYYYDGTNEATYIYLPIPYPETKHPYSNNEDAFYRFDTGITNSNVKIIFNPNTETEPVGGSYYDYIDIYVLISGVYYKKRLVGAIGAAEIVIPNSQFWLLWHTDSSQTYWGWKIDSIESTLDTVSTFSQEDLPTGVSWTVVDCTKKYGWTIATVENYVHGTSDHKINSVMTQEEIFNTLTNGGQEQGIWLKNGQVWLNGTYIKANTLNANDISAGSIKSNNYSYTSGNYSDAGTLMDITNGLFRSKNFAIDSSGRVYIANGATIGGYAKTSDLSGYATTAGLSAGTTEINGDCITTGEIKSANYSRVISNTYNTNGSLFNLTNGNITTPNLASEGDTLYVRKLVLKATNSTETGTGYLRIMSKTAGYYIDHQYNKSNYYSDGYLRTTLEPMRYTLFTESGYARVKLDSSGVKVYRENYDNYYVSIKGTEITKTTNGSDVNVKWDTSSDERLKENIEPLDAELSKKLIDATEPKKFKFIGHDGKHYGMIAQEARKVLDDLGEYDAELEAPYNVKDYRKINYEEYIPHIINYIKHQQSEIDDLKKEIQELKAQLKI